MQQLNLEMLNITAYVCVALSVERQDRAICRCSTTQLMHADVQHCHEECPKDVSICESVFWRFSTSSQRYIIQAHQRVCTLKV